MPAPHSRGKGSRKARKGKAPLRQRTETTPAAAQQPAAARPAATTAPAPRTTAAPRATTTRAAAAAKGAPARQFAVPEYPYVSGELARIGILAVVLVVILIVLSRVLS
jgi:hypothetical protein